MSFWNEINQIKDRNINLNYPRKNMKRFQEYVREIIKCNPGVKAEEVTMILNGMVLNVIDKCKEPTRSDVCLHNTAAHVLQNIESIDPIMKSMDRNRLLERRHSYVYNFNFSNNVQNILQDLGNVILTGLDFKSKRKIIDFDLSDKEKQAFYKVIKNMLEKYDNQLLENILEGYKSRILAMSTFLYTYGSLEENNERNNKVLKEMDLSILGYEFCKKDKKKVAIEDLCNEEYLKSLKLEELIAIDSFISNRTVKELENFYTSFYIFLKKGAFQKIIDNQAYEIEISDEELKELLYQEKYLGQKSKKIITDTIQNHEEAIKNGSEDEISLEYTLDTTELTGIDVKKYTENEKEEYEEYYKKQFTESENNMDKDLIIKVVQEVYRHRLYSLKDFSMTLTLGYLLQYGDSMNWGYIPEYTDGLNSVQNAQEKNILLGIDFEGYNYPIRLHIQKEKIKEMMRQYNGTEYIPVYEGHEDMIIDSRYISTQILMPLQKFQKKALTKLLKSMSETDYRYKFIRHIKGMSEPNVIQEYMHENGATANFRRMINLDTGEITLKERKNIYMSTEINR